MTIYLILIMLVGLHVSPLLFFITDMWRAHGCWAQMTILFMLCSMFYIRPIKSIPRNIPVLLLTLYLGLSTGFLVYAQQFKNIINIYNFLPFFNYLCIVVFYIWVSLYLNKKDISIVIKFIKYCIIAELLLCALQALGISQFFKLYQDDYRNYSIIVGMLGNGTHLSGFLATCACLFFTKKREDILALILLVLVLTQTGTQRNDPAISGFVVLSASSAFYLYHISKKEFFKYASIILGLGLLGSTLFYSHISKFFSPGARIELWSYYLNQWIRGGQELTGYGLGLIRAIFQKTSFPTAAHLHNEYLHFTFELGVIGLFLIINLVLEFLKISPNSKESLLCKTMFFGFLVSSLFNYPAHLWMVSIYACFSYAAFISLERNINAS